VIRNPFRRRVTDAQITALAKAIFDVGLTSIGPDDLDNRQIASRLLLGGHVR
jgi:hypothetical protein